MAETTQLTFEWDTLITPLPDGRVMLTPRRVHRPSTMLRSQDVMARTGYSRRQSIRLMRSLGARQGARGHLLFLDRAVLEEWLGRKC